MLWSIWRRCIEIFHFILKIQLEFIYFEIYWGSAFYFTECSFPSHQTEDWHNHDTCSNYNFGIETLLLFLSKYETVKAVHFARDVLCICQVICQRLGALSFSQLLPDMRLYVTFDWTLMLSTAIINILIILHSEQTWNSLLRKAVMSRYAQKHRHISSVALLWLDKQVDFSMTANTYTFRVTSFCPSHLYKQLTMTCGYIFKRLHSVGHGRG